MAAALDLVLGSKGNNCIVRCVLLASKGRHALGNSITKDRMVLELGGESKMDGDYLVGGRRSPCGENGTFKQWQEKNANGLMDRVCVMFMSAKCVCQAAHA